MHDFPLEAITETVGEILAEAEVGARAREKAALDSVEQRFALFAERDAVDRIKADLAGLTAQRGADREGVAAAIVELEVKLADRFEQVRVQEQADAEERLRALAPSIEAFKALETRLGEAVTAAHDGFESIRADLNDALSAPDLVKAEVLEHVQELRIEHDQFEDKADAAFAKIDTNLTALAETSTEAVKGLILEFDEHRKATDDYLSAIETKLVDRFDLAQRKRKVETREAVLDVAAPKQAVEDLRADIAKLFARADETVASLSAEGSRIEKAALDVVSLTIRELSTSIWEKFDALAKGVKNGVDGLPGAPGPAGPRGPGIVHRGTYDPQAAYAEGDEVMSKGSTFRALKADPGPLPGEGWQMAAQRGKQGDKGEAGPRGPAGPAGPQVRSLVHMEFDDEGLVAVFSDGTRERAEFTPRMRAAISEFEVIQ